MKAIPFESIKDGKVCGKCGTKQPVENFAKCVRLKAGLQSWCKACSRSAGQRTARNRKQSSHVASAKLCPGCDLVKPAISFYKSARSGSGLETYCKDCERVRKRVPRVREYQAEYREKNLSAVRERQLDNRLRRRLGISSDDKRRMIESQGGKCAICQMVPVRDRFCVDHCHATGNVREVLCHKCNAALGLFKDNPAWLRRAADYIETHEQRFQDNRVDQ